MASLLVGGVAPPMVLNSHSRCAHISFSQSLSLSMPFPCSKLSLSVPPPTSTPSFPSVYCGRGDRKTAKGKRFNHSYGNARPRTRNKGRGPPRIPVPSVPEKQDPFDDGQVVKIEIDES